MNGAHTHTDPKSKTSLNLTKHAMQNDINNKNNAEELFCKTNTWPGAPQTCNNYNQEAESTSKASFKRKQSVQTTKSLKRRYNGRVQRGVFVHSAVNTAAPGISIQSCCIISSP